MDFALTLAVVVICIGIGFLIGRKFRGSPKNTGIRPAAGQVLPIAEFACLVYHYKDIVEYRPDKGLWAKFIPGTGKKGIYIAEGTIKLGFKGEKIRSDYRRDSVVVYVPLEITSNKIHGFTTYDEQTGIFGKFTADDYDKMRRDYEAKQEAETNKNLDLFAQARQPAEQVLKALLDNIPGIKGRYKIVFEMGGTTIHPADAPSPGADGPGVAGEIAAHAHDPP